MLKENQSSIHYVLAGEGSVILATGDVHAIFPHSVILAPPEARFSIATDVDCLNNFAEPDCKPMENNWSYLTVGDGAPGLTVACGYINATYLQVTKLFKYLQEPLVDSVEDERAFRTSFHNLLDELSDPKPGTKILAEMLMKQCLITFLRNQSEKSGKCCVPWLAALGDEQLGCALSAMQNNPQKNHTLENLGELAGLSRSVFAERFKEVFDRTAIDCLKEIRIRRAAHLLTTTSLPIKRIAYKVGFESRSYFSRVFKSYFGINPLQYRARPTVNLISFDLDRGPLSDVDLDIFDSS